MNVAFTNASLWPSAGNLTAFATLYKALPASLPGSANTEAWAKAAASLLPLLRGAAAGAFVVPAQYTTLAGKLPGYHAGASPIAVADPTCASPVCPAQAAQVIATSTFPVPSALPPHNWDTMGGKLFIHGCKTEGLFNATELALAAKFGLLTVEKGQGLALPGFADVKMAAIAAQWKAARRKASLEEGWALFYLNAHFDWPFFAIHAEMEAHPGWPQQLGGASSGDPCLGHGDKSFPQPAEGMLLFNHSHKPVRAAFIGACVNAIQHGFDGCFIDSAAPVTAEMLQPLAKRCGNCTTCCQPCSTSYAAVAAAATGKNQVMVELQEAVGDGKLIVAKDSFQGGSESVVNTIFPLDTFCSCYSCNWSSTHPVEKFRLLNTTYAEVCQTQILEAIRLGQRGQVVLLHGEVNQGISADRPQALKDDFEFALAAFLIASSETAFFGYSDGWYYNGTTWHAEYDRKLGAPTALAKQGDGMSNMSWSRSFASGTTVELDVLRRTAAIHWAK